MHGRIHLLAQALSGSVRAQKKPLCRLFIVRTHIEHVGPKTKEL